MSPPGHRINADKIGETGGRKRGSRVLADITSKGNKERERWKYGGKRATRPLALVAGRGERDE